jgi:2-oxoisovalerate dehydrogenase E1 component
MAAEPQAPPLALAELLARHAVMQRIRSFETRVGEMFRNGQVPGFVHLSIGQEAIAAGVCAALRPDDAIASTHRGHGHCIAKGADIEAMLAELMARDAGMCRGRGGSMHIADTDLGILGANGIVGAGLPIAVGAAAAFRQLGRDSVVVAFFGDGAIATGAFHEAMNLAALWRLPVLFVCENNHFAEFTAAATSHPAPPAARAAAYGMPAVTVDGNDILAIEAAATRAVADARAGRGPTLIEAVTYRIRGHYEGDAIAYRDEEEYERWAARDPLALSAARIDAAGGSEERLALEREADDAIERARVAVAGWPEPAPETLHEFVIRPRDPSATVELPVRDDGGYRIRDAIHDALAGALEDDPRVWLAGIDIGAGGNIFTLTQGLHERFPGRVLDTPISETAIAGLAVGGAMAGTRPVIELMYLDFLGVCFDQLLNQAAKLPYMTGGNARMSFVLRTQFGAGRSSGSQHSQSLEALLAHIPGLTVVMPSDGPDAYGLLRAAIEDPNPVIFIEHRGLYGWRGGRPEPEHRVPLGKAAVRRAGSDVTVVTWSRMTHVCLRAAERLAEEGIDAEVIDLRTILPLDEEAITASVARTSRLVVVHEAVRSGGFGAEIAARVADAGFWDLDAPVRRVAPPFTPVPYAPGLEQAWLPQVEDVEAAIRDLLRSQG